MTLLPLGSLFWSHTDFLKLNNLSESTDLIRTLYPTMAFINMDAIIFYQPNPLKAGPCGDKRSSARIRNIPIAGENYKRCQALGSISPTSESLQDYDPIEVLDMSTSQADEPLDPYGKVGAAANGGRLDVAAGLSNPTIPTRTEDFVYTANEHRINHGHSCIGDDASQNLTSLDELLFGATGPQEPQQAGESGVHSEMLGESLDRVVENGWREGDSPKPGWGESNGSILALSAAERNADGL